MQRYIGTKIIHAEPQDRPTSTGEYEEGNPGYKVVYEDGYVSWSPKEVFEAAYQATDGVSFGFAIEMLRMGKRVARAGWNGVGIFLKLQRPDENSKMTGEYIYIDTTRLETDNPCAPKVKVPWLASQTDMLATDWIMLD